MKSRPVDTKFAFDAKPGGLFLWCVVCVCVCVCCVCVCVCVCDETDAMCICGNPNPWVRIPGPPNNVEWLLSLS
jgi:hypothetical protein